MKPTMQLDLIIQFAVIVVSIVFVVICFSSSSPSLSASLSLPLLSIGVCTQDIFGSCSQVDSKTMPCAVCKNDARQCLRCGSCEVVCQRCQHRLKPLRSRSRGKHAKFTTCSGCSKSSLCFLCLQHVIKTPPPQDLAYEYGVTRRDWERTTGIKDWVDSGSCGKAPQLLEGCGYVRVGERRALIDKTWLKCLQQDQALKSRNDDECRRCAELEQDNIGRREAARWRTCARCKLSEKDVVCKCPECRCKTCRDCQEAFCRGCWWMFERCQ